MTDADAQIGQRIILMRRKASLSQKDLADALREGGLAWSQTAVWKVEQGTRPVRLTEAVALAEVLKCTLSDLVDGGPAAKGHRLRGEAGALLEEAKASLEQAEAIYDRIERLERELRETPDE